MAVQPTDPMLRLTTEMRRIIGLHVATLREQSATHQRSLAEAIGVTQQTVSAWEGGKSIPTDANVRVLARHLQLEVEELWVAAAPQREGRLRIVREGDDVVDGEGVPSLSPDRSDYLDAFCTRWAGLESLPSSVCITVARFLLSPGLSVQAETYRSRFITGYNARFSRGLEVSEPIHIMVSEYLFDSIPDA